jgi:hypothetical protein
MIYSHVIEHSLKPHELVAEAKRVLSDDGIAYVEIPDALRYGRHTPFFYREFFHEHINHFDTAHLVRLFESSGFQCLDRGTRLIDRGGGVLDPCAYGVFRACSAETTTDFSADYTVANAIHAYFQRHDGQWTRQLRHAITSSRPVYIWGLSSYTFLLLGTGPLTECNIRAFVDRDPWKQQQTLLGRRVLQPQVLADALADAIVVISAGTFSQEMLGWLKEIGFRGTAIVPGRTDQEEVDGRNDRICTP